jgi:hypothetical protein
MPTTLETSLEELKAERRPLADEFDKNPQRLHLAITVTHEKQSSMPGLENVHKWNGHS